MEKTLGSPIMSFVEVLSHAKDLKESLHTTACRLNSVVNRVYGEDNHGFAMYLKEQSTNEDRKPGLCQDFAEEVRQARVLRDHIENMSCQLENIFFS